LLAFTFLAIPCFYSTYETAIVQKEGLVSQGDGKTGDLAIAGPKKLSRVVIISVVLGVSLVHGNWRG
jgi:hypothetical protein